MRVKDSSGDRAFYIVNYAILITLTAVVVYPLIYVISASVSNATAIASNEVYLWPVGFNLDAYRTIWENPGLIRGFGNSLLYTIGGALIGTILTVLAGYAASRDDLPFRKTITFFFLIPTLVSAGIVPTYIVVRQLGLLETRWAIILPGAMSVFNVIITRTFYKMTIPLELLEAARVDGSDDFRFFFRIAIPLSKPIIAVNMLFYGVTQWNGWFNAFLYTSNANIAPLQLMLRELLSQSAIDPAMFGGGNVAELLRRRELFDLLKYAVIVVSIIPPLIAYPLVQKHFVKGVMIGSLK